MPSPDHSTFSRFRARLSKKGMIRINSEALNHFAKEGITINEGIAVDARLVKSASRPISNDEIKKLRKKKETTEGKVDKNSSRYKF
jgi:IS5 family transposase